MTRFVVDPARSQVWIDGSSTVHPVRATATGLEGMFEADVVDGAISSPVSGRIEIAVERLRSGNPLVDRETRRRVDARRYPTIEGRVTETLGVDGPRARVRGVIDFRGESRTVEGALDITPTEDGVHIEGQQTFDVRDWGLDPPRLLALKVHPQVEVRVSVEAVRE